jgi:GT2 family glycosyltransferase
MHPILQQFSLSIPPGTSIEPLGAAPVGPFWQQTPLQSAIDYADGIEELIADYNQQAPDQLVAWAKQHPLSRDQRFILEYNTSSDRANVLRPLPIVAGQRVLEIGSGCGPISNYLWNRTQTLSIEASPARAHAAAHLLARNNNPHGSALLCTDFHQLAGSPAFDWVILNGVLEYAAVYSGAKEDSPYVAMLEKARSFLRPGGLCIIAIENRLGFKYLAGAPEDHYGRTSVGLEGYLSLARPRAPIRTFSRPGITRLLRDAGFAGPEYLFPFPDYKFAKVVVPDIPAAWSFAAARLIEASPSWRAQRGYAFDEPAFLRAAADDGLAGEFANSFVAIAAAAGDTTSCLPLSLDIHYYPLQRDPATSVSIRFDLEGRRVERRRLSGGSAQTIPTTIRGKLLNPLARFTLPEQSTDGSTIQPLTPEPSLWESLRSCIGATADQPKAYATALQTRLLAYQERYLASLPFSGTGNWVNFVTKLRATFVQCGLLEHTSDALSFLEGRAAFATESLAQLGVPAWCVWAPDWIPENLFPDRDGKSVHFFDIEYLDFNASLPTPALVLRQLKVLHRKVSHPSLVQHWPFSSLSISVKTSAVCLPQPLAFATAHTLWPTLSTDDVGMHLWFWSKVAEIIECAITGSVHSPYITAFETIPWAKALGGELQTFTTLQLSPDQAVELAVAPSAETESSPQEHDELAAKERQIQDLAQALREQTQESLAKERQIKDLAQALREQTQESLAKERQIKEIAEQAESRLRMVVEQDAHTRELMAHASALEQRLQAAESAQTEQASQLQTQLHEKQQMIESLATSLTAKEATINHLDNACTERLALIEHLSFLLQQLQKKHGSTISTNNTPIRFHIEDPISWTGLKRTITIRGWIYMENGQPIKAVRILVSGHTHRNYALIPRPDVDKAFALADGMGVGFATEIELPHADNELSLGVWSGEDWYFTAIGIANRASTPTIGYWLGRAHAARKNFTKCWRALPLEERQGLTRFLRQQRLWNLGSLNQYPPRPVRPLTFPSVTVAPSALPKFTIVTPSFNQGTFLPRTMDSVLAQQGIRLDYIVQDGGSTDQSAAEIRSRADRLKHWESIRDAGQTDAIVRGFSHTDCTPDDILGYLNSDDILLPGVLAWIAGYFNDHPEVDAIYGHRILIDENGQEIGRWFTPDHDPELLRMIDFVPQETLFWRKRTYDRAGGFDPSFHFAMDWDFLLRLEHSGARIVRVPHFLACFRIHAAQKTSSQISSTGEAEMRRLRLRELGREPTSEEIQFWWDRGLTEAALIEHGVTSLGRPVWPNR